MDSAAFKPVWPKEHGLWVWVLLPVVVGGLCAKGNIAGFYFLIGTVFFGFLSLTPTRIFYKNRKREVETEANVIFWAFGYFVIAAVFAALLLKAVPTFLYWLPFMAAGFYAGVRAFHGGYHHEAWFEFGGLSILSLGTVAGTVAVTGKFAFQSLGICLLTLLFLLDRSIQSRRIVRLGGFRLALAAAQTDIAEKVKPVFLSNLFISFMAMMFALATVQKFKLDLRLFWAFVPGFFLTLRFWRHPPPTLKRLGYSEVALAALFAALFTLIFRFYSL